MRGEAALHPEQNELDASQQQAVECVRQFIENLDGYNRDKFRAQLKLTLRELSGAENFRGSGIDPEDAGLLATDSETGFLQLGKMHLKGPENEGKLDFFDRYGWVGGTTKFSDLVLVFSPGTNQLRASEDVSGITDEQWKLIESAGFSRTGIQGLRPGTDVLYVIYNPNEQKIQSAVQNLIAQHPEFSSKIRTIEEFSDSLSPEGLLPGEKLKNKKIDMQSLIDALSTMPIGHEELFTFIVADLLPVLASEDKISVVAELLKQPNFVSGRDVLEYSEGFTLLKTIELSLSDQDVESITRLLSQEYQADQALPLIYLKFAAKGRKLPESLLEIILLNDQEMVMRRFVGATPEEWNVYSNQLQSLSSKTQLYTYFLSVTRDRTHEDRLAMAESRHEYAVLHRTASLAHLQQEIVEMHRLPQWKRLQFKVRQKFLSEPPVAFAAEKQATQAFMNEIGEFQSMPYQIAKDLRMYTENVGESWVHDPERELMPWEISPSAEKVSYLEELIPTVLPEFGAQLNALLNEYRRIEQAEVTT